MKKTINQMQSSSLMLLVLSAFLFSSCSNDEVASPSKGAVTPLMQGIAANVPYIQSVEKDSTYQFAEGVQITDVNFTYCTKPTRMIVAEIDLTKNVTLATCTPDNKNIQDGVQLMTEQAMNAEKNAGKKVLVGINGDYFGWNPKQQYVSQGVFYKEGIAIKDFSAQGFNSVMSVQNNGDVRISSTAEFQLIKKNVKYAIGGWQRMVEDGEICSFEVNDNSMDYHPRTFVGISKDNTKFYLFVLDGRQPSYSNGMRLRDMMLLCQGAGCYQAFNLDGGGSSTFVYRNEKSGNLSFDILNTPSDRTSGTSPKVLPRAVINGLLVVQK